MFPIQTLSSGVASGGEKKKEGEEGEKKSTARSRIFPKCQGRQSFPALFLKKEKEKGKGEGKKGKGLNSL